MIRMTSTIFRQMLLLVVLTLALNEGSADRGGVLAFAYALGLGLPLLAFALDALAIAGQALTGRGLGAADVAGVREATATMVRWGIVGGAVVGMVVAASGPLLAPLFSADPQVRAALASL